MAISLEDFTEAHRLSAVMRHQFTQGKAWKDIMDEFSEELSQHGSEFMGWVEMMLQYDPPKQSV